MSITFLLIPSITFGAIAFDVATNGGSTSASSHTFSHTATTTENGIIFVGAYGGTGVDFVTGITYGGEAMTEIAKRNPAHTGTNHVSYLYYLLSPSTGANDVVISASQSVFISGGAATYTGVRQSGVPDATVSNGGTGSSLTTITTTTVDNAWVVMLATTQGAQTAGTGSTARTNTSISWDIFDSGGAITPAGGYSMTTNGVEGGIGHITASFAPVAEAPPALPTLFSQIIWW